MADETVVADPVAAEALGGATLAGPSDAPAAGTAALASDPLGAALGLIAVGGPVVMILAAMSVFALAIVLAKLWQFSRARFSEAATAREAAALVADGDAPGALALLAPLRGVVAGPLWIAVQGRRDGRAYERLREAAYLAAADGVESLRGWLRPLEAIAALAPLLGLLGTVLGMIDAFAALEAAGSQVDPAILSGGIWEALLTTAVGLGVAIPATAALNWFDRRIERHEHAMEQLLGAVLCAGDGRAATPQAVNEEFTYEKPGRIFATAGE